MSTSDGAPYRDPLTSPDAMRWSPAPLEQGAEISRHPIFEQEPDELHAAMSGLREALLDATAWMLTPLVLGLGWVIARMNRKRDLGRKL